jgi:hypothetical protein
MNLLRCYSICTSFFDVLYEVQKDLQEVSAGIGVFGEKK